MYISVSFFVQTHFTSDEQLAVRAMPMTSLIIYKFGYGCLI